LKVFAEGSHISPHLRYLAEKAGTKNAVHFLYHDIKYLGRFYRCATAPFVIGYKHNLLISITKGATEHVYFTQYPYPTSERILHHPTALLAFIVPFTNSISSNILRSLNTLFGLSVNRRRFYTFMASNKLPWIKLWQGLWGTIPNPLTDGRLLIALDDFINPKTGRKIFGCAHFFDHAAKANQSKYPWAQNVVLVGLLKRIKGRWACLPLAHRFYLVSERKLTKTVISSKARNLIVLKIQALKISPYGRNDKKRGFRSDTI